MFSGLKGEKMTLTIEKKYKIEKACERSKTNAMKRAISLVLITDTVAVATNGRILAVVPVERTRPFEDMLVSGDTIAAARLGHAVVTAQNESSPADFPKWEKVLDSAELVPNRCTVTFSLKLLASLANAIGATDQVTFAIDIEGERNGFGLSYGEITEAILVTSRDSEGRGLLMPMACV